PLAEALVRSLLRELLEAPRRAGGRAPRLLGLGARLLQVAHDAGDRLPRGLDVLAERLRVQRLREVGRGGDRAGPGPPALRAHSRPGVALPGLAPLAVQRVLPALGVPVLGRVALLQPERRVQARRDQGRRQRLPVPFSRLALRLPRPQRGSPFALSGDGRPER